MSLHKSVQPYLASHDVLLHSLQLHSKGWKEDISFFFV